MAEIDQQRTLYLQHLRVERRRSPHTLAAYGRDLERYGAFLADRGIASTAEIDEAVVRDFAKSLTAPGPEALAASSVARVLSSVRSFHRFLLDEGLTEQDPARAVTPPKLPRRLPKALGVGDVAALLAACGGDEPDALRDRALLELLYATGMRISEAVTLDVDDVLAPGVLEPPGLLRVIGKGGKQRQVVLGEEAQQAVQQYLVRVRPGFAAHGRGTPALFLGVRGGRLSRQHAWLILRAAAERAGINPEQVSPHVLRHSFATHLLTGGADVRIVQELLGHASVATTQIYTKVTIDTLREVYLEAHPRARGR